METSDLKGKTNIQGGKMKYIILNLNVSLSCFIRIQLCCKCVCACAHVCVCVLSPGKCWLDYKYTYIF